VRCDPCSLSIGHVFHADSTCMTQLAYC